jgi:MFS family permease
VTRTGDQNASPNGGFPRLLAAEVISPLGDAMGTVALILHLQQTRGTGTAVATVFVAESLPPLLSPWLGALAVRHHGRAVLVTTSLAQALVVALIAATLPGLAPLFALVLLRAAFATVGQAASGAAVPALVDDAGLPRANALLGGGRELGSVIGPPAAGLLFAWAGGARTVLAIDAVTFLGAAALVARLRLPPVVRATATTLRADSLEGLRHLWRTPILRGLALSFWLFVLATAADDLALPFLGADELGAGPSGIGVLLGAASIGLLVGLALVARRTRGWPPLVAVLAGFAVTAGGNLLTAAAPALTVAIVCQVLRGVGTALVEANVRTFVQRTVPRAVLGRVLANLYGGVGVAAAASYAIGGPLLDATSPRLMFVLIGGLGLVAAGAGAVLTRQRGPVAGAPLADAS